MPLSNPREGEPLGFRCYPSASFEVTLGNPEAIIWSSIHHLCSRSAAEWHALKAHGIRNKRDRAQIARNLKLYVQQASEFYQAASSAKPNTAPLIYYYSFLNLAKALCELRNPGFHRRAECYAHGLSWKPDIQKLVDPNVEKVTLRGRGVWHVLWESLTRFPCPQIHRAHLPLKKLFSYCPEISVEYARIFGGPVQTVDLYKPDLSYDKTSREAWLTFSVKREELRDYRLSVPSFLRQIQTQRSTYTEVTPADKASRSFQSAIPKKLAPGDTPWSALHTDILGMNLIAHLSREAKMMYSVPLQEALPLRMPQLVVSYTILFWLGSLVRYDPHSVHALMDSPYWILIDGFMTQSRVWLLELFEWALYQTETILMTAR
jgi:hypothetical protein